MKLTLITILLGFGTSAASFAADAFRVYAPCCKTQTLWIVEPFPMETLRGVRLRFRFSLR